MSPRFPAAFINIIAESGSKDEAIKHLQELWDEKCDLRFEVARLREALWKITRIGDDQSARIAHTALKSKDETA